jgi:hypothetical protein
MAVGSSVATHKAVATVDHCRLALLSTWIVGREMSASGSHILRVIESINERLQAAGFVRRNKKSRVYLKPLMNEVSAWVGLTTRTLKTASGEVAVRPVVGVRHEPLMQVFQDAAPSLDLKNMPSISSTLPTLMGNAAFEWVFPANADAASVADDLVQHVMRVGLSWCESVSTLVEMRRAVQERRAFGPTFSNETILPLLDVFCGKPDSALQRLEKSLVHRGDRTDGEALEFKEFADGLKLYISRTAAG